MRRKTVVRVVLFTAIIGLAILAIAAWKHPDEKNENTGQPTESVSPSETPTPTVTATLSADPKDSEAISDGTEKSEKHGCCKSESDENRETGENHEAGDTEQKDCCRHREEASEGDEPAVPDCCGG